VPCGVRAGLAALAAIVVAAAPAAGQQGGVDDPVGGAQAIQQQLGQYRQKYAEVSAQEVDVLARLDVARQAKLVADDTLARLQSQVSAVTLRVRAAVVERGRTEAAARRADAALLRARATAARADAVLAHQAIDAYMGQGSFGVLTATLNQAVPIDGAIALEYAEVATDVQNARVEQDRVARREADLAATAAKQADITARAAASEAARDQTALTQARDQQAVAARQEATNLEAVKGLLAQVDSRKAAYQLQLDQLAQDSHAIAAMLRTRATNSATTIATTDPPRSSAISTSPPSTTATTPAVTSHAPAATTTETTTAPTTTPTAAPATDPSTTAAPKPTASTFPQDYSTGTPPRRGVTLRYPIPGAPVVSTFGMRMDPVLHVYRMHEGIDIYAPEGTPIHAAGSGTIIWTGPRHGYGNAVFIDHGNGVVTVYAHQSRIAVRTGQHVSSGQVIGYVGHTGLAAGPHLHFEVRIDGTAYDPLRFVSPS
jgi:murein DD-endopeptidase MepM/ murein hydrolase activator NlpD